MMNFLFLCLVNFILVQLSSAFHLVLSLTLQLWYSCFVGLLCLGWLQNYSLLITVGYID